MQVLEKGEYSGLVTHAMKKSVFVIVLIIFSPVLLFGSVIKNTRMLTQPAISKDHIAFIYADHLWMANFDGSDARRLTTSEGIESNPVFSPDGRLLAFSGQYHGNTDVYLLNIIKGVDPQLQKAIDITLKELGQRPPVEVLRPAYPVKVHH